MVEFETVGIVIPGSCTQSKKQSVEGVNGWNCSGWNSMGPNGLKPKKKHVLSLNSLHENDPFVIICWKFDWLSFETSFTGRLVTTGIFCPIFFESAFEKRWKHLFYENTLSPSTFLIFPLRNLFVSQDPRTTVEKTYSTTSFIGTSYHFCRFWRKTQICYIFVKSYRFNRNQRQVCFSLVIEKLKIRVVRIFGDIQFSVKATALKTEFTANFKLNLGTLGYEEVSS